MKLTLGSKYGYLKAKQSEQINSAGAGGGYTFRFLLIFLVLRVHETGTFMPNSSVFIEMMMCTIYGLKCKHAQTIFGKRV